MHKLFAALLAVLVLAAPSQAAEPNRQAQQAHEVTDYSQKTYYDSKTGVYFKTTKPDLELYRTTKKDYLRERTRRNVDAWNRDWKAEKPSIMETHACLAKVLWWMSETDTEARQAFWRKADQTGLSEVQK